MRLEPFRVTLAFTNSVSHDASTAAVRIPFQSAELSSVSQAERSRLIEPLQKIRKQVFRYLQEFRDRLSESTQRVFFGVPLRTAEVENRDPRAGNT